MDMSALDLMFLAYEFMVHLFCVGGRYRDSRVAIEGGVMDAIEQATGIIFEEPSAAFDAAIAAGRLSADPAAENYAGNFMYMGSRSFAIPGPSAVTRGFRPLFKHCCTREYLP